MYPSPPIQGSMAPRRQPSSNASTDTEEPDADEFGGPSDQDADDTGTMGPTSPAAQFAGMGTGLTGATGTPGPLQQTTQPAMGGTAPGVGNDMALNQARAEFTQAITVVQSLAENFPMAGEQVMMAVQALAEGMLMVGQAVQQPPVAPEMGA